MHHRQVVCRRPKQALHHHHHHHLPSSPPHGRAREAGKVEAGVRNNDHKEEYKKIQTMYVYRLVEAKCLHSLKMQIFFSFISFVTTMRQNGAEAAGGGRLCWRADLRRTGTRTGSSY